MSENQKVVIVVGAGRSGTSTITRGLSALGIELGNNLKPGSAKNPKGFFEDLDILKINRDISTFFGLTTTGSDVRPVDQSQFHHKKAKEIQKSATEILKAKFSGQAIWGFKSGGVLRLLPFWENVLTNIPAEPIYVVALRNPSSVAMSRKNLNPLRGVQEKSDLEWLARMVPFFFMLKNRKKVVVDYDTLLSNPARQLERMATVIGIEITDQIRSGIQDYSENFVEPSLRHHTSSNFNEELINPITLRAYKTLSQIALDKISFEDNEFWDDSWKKIENDFQNLSPVLKHIDLLEHKLRAKNFGFDNAVSIILSRIKSKLKII
ncbi:MAG: hypothetical protein CBC29_05375 [Methylococcaceae bacterium TMED69]|nr:MAG: hypothetical protein CBC29_05375 [Methylococcaceae bacterium TMED69]